MGRINFLGGNPQPFIGNLPGRRLFEEVSMPLSVVGGCSHNGASFRSKYFTFRFKDLW
jgi:hypothetical protein